MTNRELTGIVRYGIQGKGMPGFASSLKPESIKAVVRYLRLLGGKGAERPLPGDASRGKALYFGSARCGECHTIEGEGGFLGADLSGYGTTHSPSATREAILDPNKNADPRHGTVTVATRSGSTFTGVVRNEDNFTIQMQTPDGSFHLLEKRCLARLEHESRSLMPDDYRTKLSAAQLDDLVKFLSVSSGPQANEPDSEE
jgi:putative heme-binding domain-containing protein